MLVVLLVVLLLVRLLLVMVCSCWYGADREDTVRWLSLTMRAQGFRRADRFLCAF